MILANSSKSPSLGCSPSRARRACKLCSINLSIFTASLPWLCDHINDCRFTAIDDLDRFVESPTQLIWLRDRTKALDAQCPRNRRYVRGRVLEANTDTFIFNRPLPPARHALLVFFVVVIRPVIQDDHGQRDFVFCRRPKRVRRHHEVAVADYTDAEPSRSFVS